MRTHEVPTPGGRVHVADSPGEEPALVMMHGVPDDTRIYDGLVPRRSSLERARRGR